MTDPMPTILNTLLGINQLRKNETLSPEYREAYDLLEPYGVYMTGPDGDDVLAITIGGAADLIADNYVRRES